MFIFNPFVIFVSFVVRYLRRNPDAAEIQP
jgi:hypothetical protein